MKKIFQIEWDEKYGDLTEEVLVSGINSVWPAATRVKVLQFSEKQCPSCRGAGVIKTDWVGLVVCNNCDGKGKI